MDTTTTALMQPTTINPHTSCTSYNQNGDRMAKAAFLKTTFKISYADSKI